MFTIKLSDGDDDEGQNFSGVQKWSKGFKCVFPSFIHVMLDRLVPFLPV